MKKNVLSIFLLFSFYIIGVSQQLSVQVSLGGSVGFSKLEQINGYYYNFTPKEFIDDAMDISLKYQFKNQTFIGFSFSEYTRFLGVKLDLSTRSGQSPGGIFYVEGSEFLYSLFYGKKYKKEENARWSYDLWGGIHLEKTKYRGLGSSNIYTPIIVTDFIIREDWYPYLHGGASVNFHLKRSEIGLKLVGGLGFIYRNYYFYDVVIDDNTVIQAVSSFKGDYLGLLLTYQWNWKLQSKRKKK